MRLAHTWRKPIDLANCHIVADGNSLTQGIGQTPYTTYLASSLGVSITNFGVSGQTTQDMIDDAVVQIDSTLQAGKANVLIAWEIRNHLVLAGANAEVEVGPAVALFWDYCDARRAAGWHVIATTLLRNTQTSNTHFTIGQMNSFFDQASEQLLDEGPQHVDQVVDIRTIPELAIPSLSNTWWLDGVHLTSAGNQLHAAKLDQSVRRLRV